MQSIDFLSIFNIANRQIERLSVVLSFHCASSEKEKFNCFCPDKEEMLLLIASEIFLQSSSSVRELLWLNQILKHSVIPAAAKATMYLVLPKSDVDPSCEENQCIYALTILSLILSRS